LKFGGVDVDFDYNFKGIAVVPARALKAKKIFVCSVYLFIAFLLFNIFTYIAWMLDGGSFSELYSIYGLAPFFSFRADAFIPALIYYLGILLALFSIAVGIMVTAMIDMEELRGNQFFSAGQALGFSIRRLKQLALSWLAIILFVALIILLGVIVGLITRIPYVGEILFSLFFFFPNFIIAIFTVLIIFVFILSFLVMPAAVAASRTDETFNAILETFSTVIRQPVRWALYTIYTVITAKLAGFVFAYFAYRAVQFVQLAAGLGGGSKIGSIIASGAAHLPLKSKLLLFVTNIFPGINFGFDVTLLSEGTSVGGIAGYIMAASLFLVFLMICGYILSVIATGQAYGFAVIKKHRDGHAITEEKSLFYEEEWINPPIKTEENSRENNNNKTQAL
jgi:hypothetical protein